LQKGASKHGGSWTRIMGGVIRRASARVCAACLLILSGAADLPSVSAQSTTPLVYVIPINGTIDLGLSPFLSRTIAEAQQARAAAVLLEINTFGGRVDAAVAMRDALLRSQVRTIAYVNSRAISAGALIALACNTIIMAEGGTIGAATPVMGGSTGETKPTDEKSVSYVRKEFRATAEVRKRPPEVAEAMVDADVEIPNLIAKGKLLTLTTSEALKHNVADSTAPDVKAALAAAGLGGAQLRYVGETWAESFVRFITNPAVSSVLMTIGLLGLIVELRTPGFAVPGTVGLVSLGLFFWGHWITRLAGWEELLLIFLGVLLVALEVFVLPGFTVAGIAGIVALVAGLGLTLVGGGATASSFIAALGRVAVSLLVAIIGAFVLLRFLPQLPFGRRLVLESGMEADDGYVSAPASDYRLLGRTGTALSPMRPAGIADIDGTRVDVVSDGGFIEAGSQIEVTRVEGNRIVIRRVSPHGRVPDE
ncbi:MAG TPA: NfeD family protein, partial [Bryobacteraceae bacterium]|nr:NfeD family protein [Bryobacteraceae bacterium]